jgi:hypothetical protein
MSLVTSFGSTKSLLQSSLCFLSLTALFAAATAAAEKPILEAPTFEEVAKAIDLRKIKLPKRTTGNACRQLAQVIYFVNAELEEVWDDLQKQLVAMGCKPRYVRKANNLGLSGSFEKDSFIIDTRLMMRKDHCRVSVSNVGKSDLSKIPRFELAKPEGSQCYIDKIDDQTIIKILDESKAFLEADGFTHLATSHRPIDRDEIPTSKIFMQKNALLISLTGTFARPPDKVGEVFAERRILSLDLPIPPGSESVDYMVSTFDAGPTVYFKTELTTEQIVKYYGDELTKGSWTKLQNDDPTDVITGLPDRETDKDQVSVTFGKSNVGRIKIEGYRNPQMDNPMLSVKVTFESAEDFFNSDRPQ